MTVSHDVQHLVRALQPIETAARSLPWSAQNPWHCSSHLMTSNGVPCIDLHGLSVRLALEVIEVVLVADLKTGGAIVITGRGKHTGGYSKLRAAVLSMLKSREVVVLSAHPGRLELVFDAERVRVARPGMGLLFWLFVALLILAAATALLNQLSL